MSPMSPRLLRPRATGFDPRSIGNMVLWLDASDLSTFTLNGSAVEEWRNKAGTANVSQSTANNRPSRETVSGLNGRFAVLFDGANDVLLNTTSGLIASVAANPAFTLFVAHRTGSVSGNHCAFDIAQGSTYAGAGTIRRFFTSQRFAGRPQDSAYAAFGNRDSVYGNSISASNTAYVHSFVIKSEATSATNPEYYRNGTSSARTDAPFGDGSGNFTPSRFSVGSSSHGSAENYIGHIAEICVYTAALNATQRLSVERYLGRKYGVTI